MASSLSFWNDRPDSEALSNKTSQSSKSMQLTITPFDSPNISTLRLGNKPSKMPFFSLGRSPTKSSSSPPKQVPTSATVSESYPDTDELTLDGMTLSGMTFGDGTVSTVNLDSVIRRSVNLGGDHYSPEISVRKSSSASTGSGYYHSHGFEPLVTDDIDERIQAYRHAVSTYREQQQDKPVESPPARKDKMSSPSSSKTKTIASTDDFFNDEFTLPGVSLAGDSYAEKRSRAKYHEPRARAVFRPVVDSSKRSKAAAATIAPTISSRRKGVQVQNTLNSMRASPETTSSARQRTKTTTPPTYIQPRIESSRTTDSSEKENGRLGIHKTRSMSSFESGRTSSTTTTKNRTNKNALPPTLVELPPSSIAMTITPSSSKSQRRPSLDKLEPPSLSSSSRQRRPSTSKNKAEPLSGSRKQIHGLPDPYSSFPDDEGLYDDPPLLPLDESLCSSPVDDKEDTTSFSLDLDIMVNQSDKDLMESQGVSGALLLTAEGLKEHDKLMSGSLSPKAMDSASLHGAQYNSWSKNIEQAKSRFLKAKSSTPAKATPATPSPVKATPIKQSPVATATTKSLSPSSEASATVVKKDVASPSVSSAKKTSKSCIPTKSTNKPEKKRRGLRALLFGKKKPPSTISPFAQDLLEQERHDEEQERLKQEAEKREAERIESKRRAYLEVARQKEAAAFSLPDSLGSLSTPGESSVPAPPLAVIEESDDDCSLPFDIKPLPAARVTTTAPPALAASPSMGSSVCSSALPPCIVCRSGERTHICTPCMHFAFCGSCAETLQAKGTCAVCSRSNVTFAQVSV